MFEELFSYDPKTISPEIRERMAQIIKARVELARVQIDIAELRSRAWVGEEGVEVLIEEKSAGLAKLREIFSELALPFLKESVDVEKLMGMVPILVTAVLQSLNVPLPLLFEIVGLDVDHVKKLADMVKELVNDM